MVGVAAVGLKLAEVEREQFNRKAFQKSLLYKPTWMLQRATAKDSHCCCSVLFPGRCSGSSPGTNDSGRPLAPSGWRARIAVGIRPEPGELCGSSPRPQLWIGALGGMNGKGGEERR